MISIAICSHNRSEDVALCVSALASQLPGRNDELLIVDSCSSPEHAEALASLASAYQGQLIRLETPGLSPARNAALAAARGEWVAYLDDDTVPLPDWLSSLHRVIDEGANRLAAVGGLTQPLWPDNASAPSHIGPRWLFYLSCNQDHVRGNVTHGAKVCGANLAFRREALSAVGGFRIELGRTGDRLIGGEESLVVRLLLQRGLDVIYEPSVRVKHRIHRERLTLDWIRRRAYWEGVTETAIATANGGPFPARLAIPKLAVSALVFGLLYALTRNSDFLIRSRVAGGALAARLKPPAVLNPAVASTAKAKANA
jgi:glycosyltransferase involved in cell wall biosynthesis